MTLHIGLRLQEAPGRHAPNVVDSAPCDSIPHYAHSHERILPAGNSQQRDAAAILASNWKNSTRSNVGTAAGPQHSTSSLAFFVSGAFCAASTAARAADQTIYAVPDSSLVMGLGYTRLKGNELVYDAGNRISHLIWESDAPVLTTAFKAALVNNWTISANAAIGLSGDSHMEDYDWKERWGFDRGDWSSRDVSPDTSLDRYINVDIATGRDFVINDAMTVNLHGGFKYINVKWTAYGGTFIRSDGGFRNEIINFEPGERIISYEQRYPGVFLGAEVITKVGDWTLSGLLRGGISVDARDVDNHWLRKLLFEEEFGAQPFVSVGAKVDYQMNDRVSLFLAGNFDKYFREKGNMTQYDRSKAPVEVNFYKDAAGVDLCAFTLSAGFKLTF
ncbi:omptin family outer membrane protease [Ensifer aridi]|uniref:omptin family outer membrane protease n=1 Tax=Ensifer aridi TaxID=1708715 RepID=UPI000A120B68|nr:omptin family outer membrane protease [Ensifer aridi]